MAVDQTSRALEIPDALDVLGDAQRLFQDRPPAGRSVRARLAVRDEEREKLEEPRVPLGGLRPLGVLAFGEEQDLFSAPHLREVGDPHVVLDQEEEAPGIDPAQPQPLRDPLRLPRAERAVPAHVRAVVPRQSLRLPDVVNEHGQLDQRIANERVRDPQPRRVRA